MGCSSFICPKCDVHIYSDKYGNCIGEEVRLARLVKGRVVEWMKGRYDAYARVHASLTSRHYINKKRVAHPTDGGKHEWQSASWHRIVREHFGDDISTGLLAIHEKCWTGKFESEKSKDDPEQGWE